MHGLLCNNRALQKEIVSLFGVNIIDEQGNLSREKIRRAILEDRSSYRKYNSLVHPRVIRKIRSEISKAKKPVAIADVPLLFECHMEGQFDRIVVVSSPKHLQVTRKLKQGWGSKEIDFFINMQQPLAKKIKKADAVINNRGTIKELQKEVKRLWKELLQKET